MFFFLYLKIADAAENAASAFYTRIFIFGLFSFFRAFSESKAIASSFFHVLTFSLLRISGWCEAFREHVE